MEILILIILHKNYIKKTTKTVLIYNISYKTSADGKPLRFRFNKIDGFIRASVDNIRHLILFDYGLCDKICDKIIYLISERSGITDGINHKFEKIRIDSYNSLPMEKNIGFS